jgi:uncharacterized protein YndB with AHSA1/START domain
MDYTLRSTALVPAPPGEVFDLVTDIDRLPAWNPEIGAVLETPSVLEQGAEWRVRIRALHSTWISRSRAIEVDRDAGRFAYRSQSDDGNPSHADWLWRLEPAGDRTRVTVEAGIHPRTFLRRAVLSRLRRPGLHASMERSLAALRDQVRAA